MLVKPGALPSAAGRNPMLDVRERYNKDPVFNRMTQVILGALRESQMTPTEVREAAVLACVMHEEMNPRPVSRTATEALLLRQDSDRRRDSMLREMGFGGGEGQSDG